MAEELQGQAGGVPQTEQGTGVTPVPAPGTAAPAAPATAEPKVDLSKLEDFRKWQSERDRREAQLRREAEQARQAAEQAQSRLREQEAQVKRAQLTGADPEQIIQFYESEQQRLISHYQDLQKQQEKQEKVVQRAYQYLESVGLDRQTPGLVWPENVDEDGLVTLMESAGRILALRAQSLAESKAVETQAAAQQARTQTVQELGVAQVSTATGNSSPGLRAEYDAKRNALKYTGRLHEAIALKQEYREKGLDI